jgi:hypothetical protein
MKETKRMKKITVIVIAVIFLLCAGASAVYFLVKATSGRFFKRTYVNGYDVSGETVENAAAILEKQYSAIQISLSENGQCVLSQSLEEVGYSLNPDSLTAVLQELLQQQSENLMLSLMNGNEFTAELSFDVVEEQFQQVISADSLSEPRIASENATLEYDGTECSIKPEVYGNEFDDRDLQTLVRDALDQKLSGQPEMQIEITIPDALYFPPDVTQDDPQLIRKMEIYNQYSNVSITYLFGSETTTVDWSILSDWITVEDDTVSISEEKVYEFLYDLAARYDTIYYDRSFTATDGSVVTLPSNDYGYQIDVDAEYQQLLADIETNSAIEREPVYAIAGFSRNGRDDLNGTYIEVNLTQQHLWFYKYGSLVIESDFVSGLPKDGRETTTGAFPIAYKASPFNLKGGGGSGSDSWDVEVQYWMPFHDGQGLHDASWRTAFGGSIYLTDGSHGCINLPSDAAQVIYENAEPNMAVLLYQ